MNPIEITVYTITNNLPNRRSRQPRQPLVQIIATDRGYGDSASFAFHPKHARPLARAIITAAKAAAAGRKRKPLVLTIEREEP